MGRILHILFTSVYAIDIFFYLHLQLYFPSLFGLSCFSYIYNAIKQYLDHEKNVPPSSESTVYQFQPKRMEKREDGLAPAPPKSLCESTDAKHFHIRQLRRQGMDYPTKRGGVVGGMGGI